MVLDPYEDNDDMEFSPYEEHKTESNHLHTMNQFSSIREVKEGQPTTFNTNLENEGSLFSEKVIKYFEPGNTEKTRKNGIDDNQSESSVKEQLQYFRSRLDSLEKKVSGQEGSGSTFQTHGKVLVKNGSSSKEFEALKLSFMSDAKPELDPFSFESLYSQKLEILDFSPEWDYTSGGAKLLICFKPDLKNLIDSRVGIDVYEEIESRFSM